MLPLLIKRLMVTSKNTLSPQGISMCLPLLSSRDNLCTQVLAPERWVIFLLLRREKAGMRGNQMAFFLIYIPLTQPSPSGEGFYSAPQIMCA
jgi:hypothetical protein